MSRDLLVAKDLYKAFHHPLEVKVLSGVSLALKEKEAIAIVGASGEGKTTLLHILGLLEKADSGEIEFLGEKISQEHSLFSLRNRHVGFLFQVHNLLEDCTVLENVLMPALIARKNIKKGSSLYHWAEELLAKVGLKERAHFPAKLLSGGEKQRVALARALSNDPKILLADEPSGDLDHKNSQIFHDLLLQFVHEMGKGLIVVTHDEELSALCHRRFLLKEGKLLSHIKT